MRKVISSSVVAAGILLLAMLVIFPGMAGSSEKGTAKSSAMPANVKKITEKSCVNCHSEPGKRMALSHLNLTNWEKYSPEKQAAKAQAMCNMVSKGKMPPKKYRATHPEVIPTDDEVKAICEWARSLQPKTK